MSVESLECQKPFNINWKVAPNTYYIFPIKNISRDMNNLVQIQHAVKDKKIELNCVKRIWRKITDQASS